MKYAKLSALALVLAVLAMSAGEASAQTCCTCHAGPAGVQDRTQGMGLRSAVAAAVKRECGCPYGEMRICADGECRCPGCSCRDCPGLVLACRRERPVQCPPRRVIVLRWRR